MPIIEGIRIKNYGVLKDVTFGYVLSNTSGKPLTSLVTIIGKNGTGKSTFFDAMGFVADCLRLGVEQSCYENGRRGFRSLSLKIRRNRYLFHQNIFR